MKHKTRSLVPAGYIKNKLVMLIFMVVVITASVFSCKHNEAPTGPSPVQSSNPFDSLKTVHDSLVKQFAASGSLLDQLTSKNMSLDSQSAKKDMEIASLIQKVRQLEKKNRTLSADLKKDKSFIVSIRNKLSEKEQSLAESLGLFQTEKNKLTQQYNEMLAKYNSLKKLGSVLHVSNISIEGIHLRRNGRKEKETTRARRANVLRIRFDIDENRIAEDGQKQLYLVIKGPDGKLMSGENNSSGIMTTSAGKEVKYSVMKDVALKQNEPVKDVTVDWKQEGEHERGTYRIAIYNGGYKIGAGDVDLR